MRRIFPAMARLPQLRLELQALADRLAAIEKSREPDGRA
jgi:hypothetical protein